MLKQLTIKNLAIIDDITIDFEENLNVLTGETGAGKSIIIDAISLIFGARASSEIIAIGKESACVSAALELKEDVANYIYENFDLDLKDECIITRTLSRNSKSTLKINGILTPLHILNEISQLLIDISSQNESQYLFNHKNHLILLDKFVESKVNDFKEEFDKSYNEYLLVKDEYDELLSKKNNNTDVEFLQYKLNELKDYTYTIEDELNILNEYKTLNAISQNISTFEDISSYLENDSNGALNQLYSSLKLLSKLSSNEKINDFYEKFNSLYLDLYDLSDSFKKEFLNEDADLSKIDYLSNEITKINRLKRKYNTNNLLELKNSLINEIEMLNNYEINISKLEKKLKELKLNALNKAKTLSDLRKENSIILCNLVKQELDELYLPDSLFEINFKEVELNKNGIDEVEFYLSTNKGVPARPLIKVASGGEVSRIMLGLKSVFTRLAMVDIIIFDEIDTGVSGKVALAMGKKMEKIAKSCQVLAITHLPQVAAMSDHHYYIYKDNVNEKTKTFVNKLTNSEKLNEVARLLSGDDISDSFVSAAKELISSK